MWRRARPGEVERFDAERFGEWLELFADSVGSGAAKIVAAMDRKLVIAGLSGHVRVFDPAAIAASIDGESIDVDATGSPEAECEVGGYVVRALRADGWDAIVTLLLALEADDPDCFRRS